MGSAVPIPMPEPGEFANRRHPRYQLSVPFDVTVFRPGAVVRLSGRTQELGEGGLGGMISGTILPGERVDLSVSLPSSAEPLNMRAIVRHECELQCGFEFLSLGQEQREELQRLADSGLRGRMINSAEWEPGLEPPPRGATVACATCGFEFPEELEACAACGATQEAETAEEAEVAPAPEVARTAAKAADENKSRTRRDAVLDSVVAIVFLITLSIGLWQWLYSPADASAKPNPVTVELENVFLRPVPSVAEETPQSRPTPAFTAAKTFVSAVIGTVTPAPATEPVGVPGSAARESTRRRETAASSQAPQSHRPTPASSPAAPSRALAATTPPSSASNSLSAAASGGTSTAANSTASERPSGSDLAGMLLQKVLPMYPARARRDGVQGQVVLKAVIGKDGTIADLQPLQGPQELSQAAMDAVQHWRFRPYEMNGKPVEVETDIRLNFQLPK